MSCGKAVYAFQFCWRLLRCFFLLMLGRFSAAQSKQGGCAKRRPGRGPLREGLPSGCAGRLLGALRLGRGNSGVPA